ncbi:MAG: serine protease [Elusimicrobiaceae bacterium]|nr:serine protease [Elusimicrobiaceae bacterium]MBQ6223812.1 serine protease [Campylobacter sp.]
MKKFSTFLLFIILTLAAFAKGKSYIQIAELYGDSIVSVNVLKKDGNIYNGTGFIIDSSGLVATAGHVVKDALLVNFTFKNGAVSKEATLLALSKEEAIDLALLKIPNINLPYAILGDSSQVLAGQKISVIGNPRRLQNTITNGLISQVRQVSPEVVWFQISAPISPSSSGSPVFNKEGQVIAIALSSLKGEENQNINFAVPSNYLIDLINENKIPFNAPITEEKTDISLAKNIKNYIKRAWEILKEQISFIFD